MSISFPYFLNRFCTIENLNQQSAMAGKTPAAIKYLTNLLAITIQCMDFSPALD
jgi:hypothetical protein